MRRLLLFVLPALTLSACAPQAERVASAAAPREKPVWAFQASDVPVDPDFRFGQLQNGMRFAIRQNATPKGTALVRMEVAAGSLDEGDSETALELLDKSLALRKSPATFLERGRALYFTCSTCHGTEGHGRWGTNAPRLAGMSDWYLERQLQYFKAGIRGGHPDDIYGDQMNLVANVLVRETDIKDVVAYINTLR